MCDLGGYMFGEFLSVVAGIIIGASIVGICWGSSCVSVKEALNQANWDYKGELDRVKAKLLKKAMRKEQDKVLNNKE